MSTYMPNKDQIDRKWFIIDAKGKPLGRVAAQVAVLLRGKYKPTFTPASTFDSASAQDLMNSPTGFMVQAMEALAIE